MIIFGVLVCGNSLINISVNTSIMTGITIPEREKKMYAIVETGGKQYQVEEGRYLDVELLDGEKTQKLFLIKSL